MKRNVKLIVQVDNPNRTHYSLDGIYKREGKSLAEMGWTWIRGIGTRGMWSTTDLDKALKFAFLPTFDISGKQITLRGL